MLCKWIIGAGTHLDTVHDAWCRAQPGATPEKITITQDVQYRFELAALDALVPGDGLAFIAFDERFGNYKRVELMQAVMERGFKLTSFVSPLAAVAGNVQVEPNAFIGDGAIVGMGVRIGYNSVLLPGAQVGSGAHIRPSCWLEGGAIVGTDAQIGAHCTLRSGALVAPRVQIGRQCELGWTRCYTEDVAPKTFFDPRYEAPIYTYGT